MPRIQPRGASAFVEANGLRHHYLEYGAGGAEILILPGITSPAITWEFVAEELAPDHRVLVLDIRGRGLSDKPDCGYASTDYARDVSAIAAALGLERPIVLGHSMGARIAAAFGALYPKERGPLIVVDPPLTGPGRKPYPTTLENFLAQLHEAQAGTTIDEVRRYYPRWSDRELAIRADWLATCSEAAVAETHRLFDEEDFFAYWRTLPPPLLFVYGAGSPAVTEDGLRDVVAANPEAEVVRVEAAAHMIPWENLEGFLEPVRAFVARTAA
jgi:N-formylmaleamate deformylase